MSDAIAKINITVGNRTLEFSGSEAFVQKQINEFKELVYGNLEPIEPLKTKKKTPAEQLKEADSHTGVAILEKYPNVIEIHEGEVDILKIGGDSKSEKTRSLTLIYGWAKNSSE